MVEKMRQSGVNLKSLMYIIAGNFGIAMAYNLFYKANEIAAGGFGGIGLIVSTLTPLSAGTVIFAISIPVFIWSYFVQGFAYTLSALISTFALSLFTDLLAFLPNLTENRLLAVFCGGAIYGVSGAILVRGYVAGSGTDLLARLLVTKFRNVSLGMMVFLCDSAVVVASVFAFGDIESGIYAAGAIAVCSFVMDSVIRGFNRAAVFEIITPSQESAQALSAAVMEHIDRGVTLVPVVGMYEKLQRNMLMIAVSTKQIYEVKDLVAAYAPGSFVLMLHANEVLGEGFKGFDVTIPAKEIDTKDRL